MKNRLRDVRKKLKLNQDEFSEIIRHSRVHVSRLENQKDPLSFTKAREIIDLVNGHYKKQKLDLEDFFPPDDNISPQEQALLGLFGKLGDKDQERFLSMAEAYVHPLKKDVKK